MARRSRRDFLRTTAAASSLVLLSPKEVLALIQNGIFVRQNVNSLGPNSPDIVAYKAGITKMKGLPAANCLNWNNWANVHGIGPAPPAPAPASPQWNTCQHGHWWFLPWHRMYLLFFERTIRKLSGNAQFSLPYWDYTAGTVAGNVYPARALPLIFRQPTVNNQLFLAQRNAKYQRRRADGGLGCLDDHSHGLHGLRRTYRIGQLLRQPAVGGAKSFHRPARVAGDHAA